MGCYPQDCESSRYEISMYENKIVRDLHDGKVTKEELNKCSTCDMRAVVNMGWMRQVRLS